MTNVSKNFFSSKYISDEIYLDKLLGKEWNLIGFDKRSASEL